MKRAFHIVILVLGLLTLLSGIVIFAAPTLTYRASTGSGSSFDSPIYLFTFAASSTSSTYTVSFLPVFIVCLATLLAPVLVMAGEEKKTVAYVGYAVGFSAFAWLIMAFNNIKIIIDRGSTTYSKGAGYAFIVIYAVLIVLLIVCDLFVTIFGEKLEKMRQGKEKSLEQRLTELNDLHDKNLISDEEYTSKRKDILNEH